MIYHIGDLLLKVKKMVDIFWLFQVFLFSSNVWYLLLLTETLFCWKSCWWRRFSVRKHFIEARYKHACIHAHVTSWACMQPYTLTNMCTNVHKWVHICMHIVAHVYSYMIFTIVFNIRPQCLPFIITIVFC